MLATNELVYLVRKKLRMRQDQFGRKFNLQKQTIIDLEGNVLDFVRKTNPAYREILELAESFNILEFESMQASDKLRLLMFRKNYGLQEVSNLTGVSLKCLVSIFQEKPIILKTKLKIKVVFPEIKIEDWW